MQLECDMAVAPLVMSMGDDTYNSSATRDQLLPTRNLLSEWRAGTVNAV